ncbi:hypothetical protein FGO68_gene7118 [Halteria grandinella]|uniref:non-specific serine/threonine protein kinase n=1 Tax=Halteria grandinella TaxID=5974 RepID=A0A8J8T2A3_HALGN|nr:hypothetical protein FGO68_gene7118 [Halteria grandinella]
MGNGCVRNSQNQSQLEPKRNKSKLDREDLLGEQYTTPADGGQLDTQNFLDPTIKISTDDFHLIKVIGRGTFGKVFMVRKKDTNQVYAMKVLKKEQIASRNLRVKTKAEREILEKIKNPFIVDLHYAFQTEEKLYFIMDFLNGGELFWHLRRDMKFSEKRARFYAAEIVCAIECLHANGIIYRDLKPENIILDSTGNLKITDFGLSKQGLTNDESKTYSFCGTPEYLAPEIITGQGHDKSVDWWSLGALIYEMLSGRPPHYSKNRKQMMQDIVEKRIEMKAFFSVEAKSLLQGLLERDPAKRLGSTEEDANELKRHPWFAKIDWQKLMLKQLEPPFKPFVSGPEDTRNIDKMFTNETPKETPGNNQYLTNAKPGENHFDQFTYAASAVVAKDMKQAKV